MVKNFQLLFYFKHPLGSRYTADKVSDSSWMDSDSDSDDDNLQKGALYYELNKDLRSLSSVDWKTFTTIVDVWAPLVCSLLSGLKKFPVFKGQVFRGRSGDAVDLLQEYRTVVSIGSCI